MSAAEDDTELRDLLIQNLENSGVLNKLKAEMRAAVFLAMEEQDKAENKTPLVNENLKKCLASKDERQSCSVCTSAPCAAQPSSGRLVASLVMDFLQVFNLDFTLAVFQPEINSLNGLDGRDLVCRELGLCESEVNKNSPLLVELVRRRHTDKRTEGAEVDRSGCIPQEPSPKQITRARLKFDSRDKEGSGSVLKEDVASVFVDLFPGLNKNMLERFVGDELRAADGSSSNMVDFQLFLGMYKQLFSQCRNVVLQDSDVGKPQSNVPEEKTPPAAVSKDSDAAASPGQRGRFQQPLADNRTPPFGLQEPGLDLNLEAEEDLDDGDSFFDDPLPKPQKTYGWKVEVSGARESPSGSLSERLRPGGGSGGASEPSDGVNGASNSRETRFRESKAPVDKSGSLHLEDDVEYDDDFNSHRSDLSRSELSIGEEIEEVSIEGPDVSDKVDETTQDLSVSQLSHSHGADYIEDVA